MQNQHLLTISAIAPNRPSIAHEITDLIATCGCNIQQSKMKAMGNTFSLILLASGEWNAIAKLEHSLPTKAQAWGMMTMLQRSEYQAPRPNKLPYKVKIVALDKPGITKEVTAFFAKQDINIRELSCDTFAALHTNAPITELKLTVGVSTDMPISSLREQFNAFCKRLNLDASLEPITK